MEAESYMAKASIRRDLISSGLATSAREKKGEWWQTLGLLSRTVRSRLRMQTGWLRMARVVGSPLLAEQGWYVHTGPQTCS